MSGILRGSILFVVLFVLTCNGDIVPTDGMIITDDVRFVKGVYHLPHGITIAAEVRVDLGGSQLIGANFQGYGITADGLNGCMIQNGSISNYYYGVKLTNIARLEIEDIDASNNYFDPASRTSKAPWLDINVLPTAIGTDFTNTGGGMYLYNVSDGILQRITLNNQQSGVDCFLCADLLMSGNTANNNTAWGFHFWQALRISMYDSQANYNNRPGMGDSAGILVVHNSSFNVFGNNVAQYCGDGFFIGNEHSLPSSDNILLGNDFSFSSANAIEATFAWNNQFKLNNCSYSSYGFWLGYAHDGILLSNNYIVGNKNAGVAIEHGRNVFFIENSILSNGIGVQLWTDGQVHFPPSQYPWLNLTDQEHSYGFALSLNVFENNTQSLLMNNITVSSVLDNAFLGAAGTLVSVQGLNKDVFFALPKPIAGQNIVGGSMQGGNYYSDYKGTDTKHDGIGDTLVPYTDGGRMSVGDMFPLICMDHPAC